MRDGALEDVRGDAVAVSRAFAATGHLRVGDRMACGWRTPPPRPCASSPIYEHAAGLAT